MLKKIESEHGQRQKLDIYLLDLLPQAVLPDEEHLPGLSELGPAVLGQDPHQDQVHGELHQQKLPEHFTSLKKI